VTGPEATAICSIGKAPRFNSPCDRAAHGEPKHPNRGLESSRPVSPHRSLSRHPPAKIKTGLCILSLVETAEGSAVWRACLFGQFRIESTIGHASITRLESKRAVALLAFLLLQGPRAHSREVLADRIWPEADPTTGRNRLKQTLASLRRQLEPPGIPAGSVFQADRNSIGLAPGAIQSDYHELLLALQSGDPATAAKIGKPGLLPDLYDEWLDDLRLWVEAQGFHLAEPDPLTRELESLTQPAARLSRRIPASPTPFVGRENEVQDLLQRLQHSRLVTATGFGGIGKTRLTMEVGRRWESGSVLFVPMAEASDVSLGLAKLAGALGVNPKNPNTAIQQIASSLTDEPLLLILDNLEQLVSAPWAAAVSELLAMCPQVRVLASSRIPLGVEGEDHFPVYPLPTPESTATLEQLAEQASAKLFIDRARRTRADFQITPRNFEAMRDLLQTLAGVPLALELCAAWAHVVSPSQMLERLSLRGEMLTSRRRDVPDRQKSLRDAFETTLSLLTPSQRKLLAQLSIFAGGCTLELAQLVTEEPISLTDLSDLLDAALLRRDETSRGSRYWMLESLRDFVHTSEEAETILPTLTARFLSLCGDLAEQSRSLIPRPELGLLSELDWIEFLDAEWANFTFAAQLGIRTGSLRTSGQIIQYTDWHWVMRGRDAIVTEWLTDLLAAHDERRGEPLDDDSHLVLSAMAGFQARLATDLKKAQDLLRYLGELAQDQSSTFARAEVLYNLGQAQLLRLDSDGFFEIMEESVRLFEESGHPWRAAMGRRMMANMCIEIKEHDRTGPLFDEAEAVFVRAGRSYLRALLVYDRSRVTYDRGDYEATVHILRDIHTVAERYGDPKLLARTGNLRGIAEEKLGRLDAARISLSHAWNGYTKIREMKSAAYPLWNLSLLICRQEDFLAGIPLLSAAAKLWVSTTGTELDEEDTAEIEGHKRAASARLGSDLADHLWREGQALSIDQVTALINKNS